MSVKKLAYGSSSGTVDTPYTYRIERGFIGAEKYHAGEKLAGQRQQIHLHLGYHTERAFRSDQEIEVVHALPHVVAGSIFSDIGSGDSGDFEGRLFAAPEGKHFAVCKDRA